MMKCARNAGEPAFERMCSPGKISGKALPTSPAGITLSNVIRLQARHWYNGSLNLWEDYYYAKGYGLVAFYAYNYMLPANPPVFQGWIDSTSGSAPVREGICNP